MSETITYFGYGSLVNDATRPKESRSVRGHLNGYVREWRIAGETPIGRVCGLTVSPDRETRILGVMILDAASHLPALDEREWRYDRHDLHHQAFDAHHEANGHNPANAFVYRAKQAYYRWGDDDHPIVQSYVDCVLKGYLEHFGEAGVQHFVDTTSGWHIPMKADREDPIYARAVQLDDAEYRLFDAVLAAAGVRYVE